MATIVYLINHGEIEPAYRGRFIGTTDAPLSARGIQQAERVRDFVVGNSSARPPTAVYCSNRSRCIQTATVVAGPFDLVPEFVGGLSEIDFGCWENLTFDQIKARWPKDLSRWMASPFHFSPHGGETLPDLRDRAVAAYERIVRDHEDETVVIVAHGGVNRILLTHVVGMPLEHVFHLEQDDAAVNIVGYYDGFPVIKLLNGTLRKRHLRGLLGVCVAPACIDGPALSGLSCWRPRKIQAGWEWSRPPISRAGRQPR